MHAEFTPPFLKERKNLTQAPHIISNVKTSFTFMYHIIDQSIKILLDTNTFTSYKTRFVIAGMLNKIKLFTFALEGLLNFTFLMRSFLY